MKVFLSVVPIFLLFNNILFGIAEAFESSSSELERNSNSLELFDNEKTSRNRHDEVRLIDLNFDVLYEIFKDLDLIDIVNLGASNSKLATSTSEIFRRRLQSKNIYKIAIVSSAKPDASPIQLIQESHRFEINDFPTAVKIIRHFGHFINWLEIQNHDIQKNHSRTIGRLLNKYCVDTLHHLDLGFIKCDTFEQFTAPFDNVTELSLIVETKNGKSGNLPMNEMFPSLQRLKVTLYADVDYKFLYCNFTNLRNLIIGASKNIWNKKDRVEQLLQMNSHIRHLNIRDFPKDYVRNISRILPNLEELTLHEFDIKNEPLCYEQLKKLNLYVASPYSIGQLSLPRLESFSMFYTSNLLTKWKEFFENHQNIKHLHLIEYNIGMSVPLAELTKNLNDLIEVTLECRSRVRAQTIIKFVESHAKLMKFELINDTFRKNSLNVLENKLSNEWNFQNSTRASVLLERKVL